MTRQPPQCKNRDTRGGREASERSPESLVPPLESYDSYPWLLYSHGEGREKQTFLSVAILSSGYEIHERNIPELRNKRVMTVCHGWYVLSDLGTAHNYSIWNPSTLQSIVFPPLKLNRNFVVGRCVLSSPPDTRSSTILLFERMQPNIMFLRIGHASEKWIEMPCGEEQLGGKVSPDQEQDDFMVFAICFNGEVYVTTHYSNNLVKVDTVYRGEEDLNKIVLTPFVRLPCNRINFFDHTRFFVESIGTLFLIYVFHGGSDFQVIAVEIYKLDSGQKQWEKVRSIEDRVFFLGPQNSISCPALSELDRGRIYFFKYSYNIEDKSLSVVLNYEDLPRHRYPPIWVIPNHHSTRDTQIKGKDEIREEEAPKEVSQTSDTEDSREINLLHLPECIIGEVSSHLALVDYMNFRTVCRVFSTAAPATEWRNTSSKTQCLTPWLLISSESRKEYSFIDPKSSGRYFMRIPEEILDATIHCSKDGWLLMSKDDDSMFFFNPFTKAILPCPSLSLGAISYHMSSAPTNSKCTVVAITTAEVGVDVFFICSGDEDWKYTEFPTGSNFKPNHNSPVLDDGTYYFFGQEGNLLVLNFIKGYWHPDADYSLKAPCDTFHQNFLVECDEVLHSVFVGDHGKWVRVFAYDLSDDESTVIWREVGSIGNWTMFLSRSSCFSMETVSEEMEDRIYFPRLNKGSLVFYSLKTGKFHSSDGENSLLDYADTTELLLCSWTESRWN